MRLTKKLATLAILLAIAALRDQMFEPGQIGFDDLFIDLLREQQRDVDVDALADELADRRQAGLGRRHLDHQVVAADRLPEPPRLGDRRVGVHRQIGRDFEADISVLAFRCLIDRAERVRRVLDILDREPLVERHDIAVALRFRPPSATNRNRCCRRWPFRRSKDWRSRR